MRVVGVVGEFSRSHQFGWQENFSETLSRLLEQMSTLLLNRNVWVIFEECILLWAALRHE